jgi:hypothetical protein
MFVLGFLLAHLTQSLYYTMRSPSGERDGLAGCSGADGSVGFSPPPLSGASPASGVGGLHPTAAQCSALRRRGLGEYSLKEAALSVPPTAPWPHQRIDARCPKYIQNDVSNLAGLGHRLSNWLVALNTALYYNATLLHDFSEAPGVHGGYAGWGEALGLPMGGGGTRELEWGSPAVQALGLQHVALPHASFEPHRVREHALYERVWGPLVRNVSQCNTVYRVGGDSWPYDFTSRAKAIVVQKLAAGAGAAGAVAAASAAAAAAAQGGQAEEALPHWDAGMVNIAVHVRKGDVYTVPQDMLARIVSESLLPALAATGALAAQRICIHVFAEFSGYGREALPALAALGDGVGFEGQRHAFGAGLRVAFWESASEWEVFSRLAQADFVVSSQSGFPSMATLFSINPLAVGFPSSNTLKHCRTDMVCCYYDGRCSFAAVGRMHKRARLLAEAEACGLLASRAQGPA